MSMKFTNTFDLQIHPNRFLAKIDMRTYVTVKLRIDESVTTDGKGMYLVVFR